MDVLLDTAGTPIAIALINGPHQAPSTDIVRVLPNSIALGIYRIGSLTPFAIIHQKFRDLHRISPVMTYRSGLMRVGKPFSQSTTMYPSQVWLCSPGSFTSPFPFRIPSMYSTISFMYPTPDENSLSKEERV